MEKDVRNAEVAVSDRSGGDLRGPSFELLVSLLSSWAEKVRVFISVNNSQYQKKSKREKRKRI